MSLPTKAKVVIIGGGIHGLSTAWKLSETYKNPGDIVVLEKKDTAAGASGIACGVVRNNYFQPAMREFGKATQKPSGIIQLATCKFLLK